MTDSTLGPELRRQLNDSVGRFLSDRYDFAARRQLIESERGYSTDYWTEFAELGWLSLPLAEEYGGAGGTVVDTQGLIQHFGRALVVEPYVSSVGMFLGQWQA